MHARMGEYRIVSGACYLRLEASTRSERAHAAGRWEQNAVGTQTRTEDAIDLVSWVAGWSGE